MKKIGKEPSDENNEDNDSDLLSDINIGKEQTREQWKTRHHLTTLFSSL